MTLASMLAAICLLMSPFVDASSASPTEDEHQHNSQGPARFDELIFQQLLSTYSVLVW
jgi:hypothetical protein